MPDDDDRHRHSPRPAALSASAEQDILADTVLSLADTHGPNRTPVDGETPQHGGDRFDILADVTEADISANKSGGESASQHASGDGQHLDGTDRNPATVEQTPLENFGDCASPRNEAKPKGASKFEGLFGKPSHAAQKGLVGWGAVLVDLGIKKEESPAVGVAKHWDLIRKKRATAVQKNAVWKSHTIDTKTVRSNWGLRSSAARDRKQPEDIQRSLDNSWPSSERYYTTSLFFLRLQNPARKACIAMIEQKWWDRVVLGLILLNTIALALYDPFDTIESRPVSVRRDVLEWISKIFAIIFTVEASVKVVALGLVGPKSYLSEAWNRLDLFIVVVGLLDLLPVQSTNLSALRSLRVMRPLRAVQRFPQLRFLVTLLLQCLPMLSNVLALCCFIFWVFGILAVQLVHGRMRGRCYDIDHGIIGKEEMPCTILVGMNHCPNGETCLLLGDNPGMGTINFDTIGAAVTVIFRVMTLEGWTEMMYLVQDVYWSGSWVYFVVLVFLGPIFAIQLFLVIITSKFVDVRSHLNHKAHPHLKGKPQLERANGGLNMFDEGDTGARRPETENGDALEISKLESVSEEEEQENERVSIEGQEAAAAAGRGQQNGIRKSFEWTREMDGHRMGEGEGGNGTNEADMVRQMSFGKEAGKGQEEGREGGKKTGARELVVAAANGQDGPSSGSSDGTETAIPANGEVVGAGERKPLPITRESSLASFRKRMRSIEESDRFVNFVLLAILVNAMLLGADHPCDPCEDGYCIDFKRFLDFAELCFVAIFVLEMVLKLFTMGVLKYVSSRTNLFDGIIVISSIIDMPGVILSLSCYSADKPCQAYEECANGGVGLTVLRMFRLLRIVKLMKAFPEVQKQIRILVSVTSSVAALIVLIFLFLLIFCILGMNLFGAAVIVDPNDIHVNLGSSVYLRLPWSDADVWGTVVEMDHVNRTLTPWLVAIKYGTERSVQEALALPPGSDGQFWAGVEGTTGLGMPEIVGVSPRSNYDDLATAAVSTFEVITLSNWYFQLHHVTAAQGALAGVYFYVIIVIGTWMLLNLFIAILIQGFAEQKAISYRRNMLQLRRTLVQKLIDLAGEDLPHKIDKMFDIFDVDETGEIDMYELNEGLLKLGIDLRPPELAEVFSRFNTSGSGSFDFEDFVTMSMQFCRDVDVPLEAFIKDPTPEQVSPEQAAINAQALEKFQRMNAADDDTDLRKKQFLKPATTTSGHGHSHHRRNSVEVDARKQAEEIRRQAEALHANTHANRRHSNLLAQSERKSQQQLHAQLHPDLLRHAGSQSGGRMMPLSPAIKPRIAFDGNGRRMSLLASDEGSYPAKRRVVAFDGNGRRMSLLGAEVRPPSVGGGRPTVKRQPTLLMKQRSMAQLKRQGTVELMAGDPAHPHGLHAAVAHARRQSVSAERVRRQSVALHKTKSEKKLSHNSLLGTLRLPSAPPLPTVADKVRQLVENKWFDRVVMLSIAVGCICLALDRPDIGTGSTLWRSVMITEFIILFIFTAEMVLKIGAYGMRKYIRLGWNRLDAFIVVTSLIDVIITVIINPQYYTTGQRQGGLGALRVLRAFKIFRALRPLRVIALATGLRVLVSTLLSAVKPVMNTILIAFAVFSALAILGQQFLAGKLNLCSDPKVFEMENCKGLDEDGTLRTWQRRDINFDNFGQSVRAVFTLATLDSWTQHMWAGVDATGRKTGPINNNNPELMLYYVVCVIVGGFLVINIFVGVFVDCYSVASNNAVVERRARLDPSILRDVHDDPLSQLRRKVADVVSSPPFEMSIAFLIVANILFMGMESYKPAEWQLETLNVANYFFTFLFTLECVAKIFAFRPRRYFMNNWNRFDYFVVVTSLFGTFADELGNTSTSINPTIIRIFRVFRIFRILRAFRIFKAARGLHSIISTLARSFPSILNLFGILLLQFFIYSILGVTLFGELCVEGQEAYPGLRGVRCMFTQEQHLLNRHATFGNVGEGMLTLFRVATGDAWSVIMERSSLEYPAGRTVTDQAWMDLRRLVGGVDPKLIEPKLDPDGDANLPIEVAAFAIKQWNHTVFGMDTDYDWPLPDVESTSIVSTAGVIHAPATAAVLAAKHQPTATEWVQLARNVLYRCLTDTEALELQRRGLMDCSIDGFAMDCKQTCGDPWFGNVFFISFVCMANFVLLQLVIAVLMEQLERSNNPETPTAELMPGSSVLYSKVFLRMHRRWRWKAGLLEATLQGAHSPAAVTQRHISSIGGTPLRSARSSQVSEALRSPNGTSRTALDDSEPSPNIRTRLLPRSISVLKEDDEESVNSMDNVNGHEIHRTPSQSQSMSPIARAASNRQTLGGVQSFSARSILKKVYGSQSANNAVASSYNPGDSGSVGGQDHVGLNGSGEVESIGSAEGGDQKVTDTVLEDVLDEMELPPEQEPKTAPDETENP